MKKAWILIVVVLLGIAGWAGSTYVVSERVEKQYYGLLNQHRQWGPVALTSQGYQRGFLSSRAETLVEMTFPKAGGENGQKPATETVQLVFEHTIHHGPLPFGGPEGQASLAPAMATVETRLVRVATGDDDQGFVRLLQEIPELKESLAFARVGFDGAASGLLQIPPFEKREGDGELLWGGATLTSKYAPGAKTLVGSFDMPKMEFRKAGGGMSWSGIRGQFDLVEAFPMLFVGSSKVAFGPLAVTESKQPEGESKVFELQAIEIVSDSRCEGSLVHVNQTMKLDGASFGGKTYGPLLCDVELKNLDGQVLSDFQRQIQGVYSEADSFQPDELVAKLLPLYGDLFTKLLAGNPELNVKRLYVATPMGEAEGTFRVKLDGMQGVDPKDPTALMQSLQHIDSAADVAVDESLVRGILVGSLKNSQQKAADAGGRPAMSDKEIEGMVDLQLAAQLEALVSQHFIVREGKKIKSSATFKQGELVVNGQPMPVF